MSCQPPNPTIVAVKHKAEFNDHSYNKLSKASSMLVKIRLRQSQRTLERMLGQLRCCIGRPIGARVALEFWVAADLSMTQQKKCFNPCFS